MKFLKILIIALLVIVGLVAIFFYSIPSDAHMERSVVIDAKPAKIFSVLNDLKQFNKWSPWFEKDPNATYAYEGVFGNGSKMSWDGNDDVGKGAMWIEDTETNKVTMGMDFGMGGEPKATYLLNESDGKTEITWTFDQEMEGTGKIFGLMIDGFLGPDYERGLAKLKSYIESMPDVPAQILVEKKEPEYYLGIKTKMPEDPALISVKMSQMYGEIANYLQTEGLEMNGAPFTVYNGIGTENVEMIAGIPVSAQIQPESDDIFLDKTIDGMVLKAIHKGSYGDLASTHEAIRNYLTFRGIDILAPVEEYITDPTLVTDTSQWVTNIYYPIKE